MNNLSQKELNEFRVVAGMATEPGWKLVETFILDNIRPIEQELNENFDLEKNDFNVLQARKQELKKVLDFVNRRIEAIQKL